MSFVEGQHRRPTQIRRYPVNGGAEDLAQRTTVVYDVGGDNGWGRVTEIQYTAGGRSMKETFSYTPAGLPTRKDLIVPGVAGLSATASYHAPGGQITYLQYPSTWKWTGSTWQAVTGAGFSYSYDALHRPASMTDGYGAQWAKDIVYDATGAITSLKYLTSHHYAWQSYTYYQETRAYNPRGQMTQMKVANDGNPTALAQFDYLYPAYSQPNNGRITGVKEGKAGVRVTFFERGVPPWWERGHWGAISVTALPRGG